MKNNKYLYIITLLFVFFSSAMVGQIKEREGLQRGNEFLMFEDFLLPPPPPAPDLPDVKDFFFCSCTDALSNALENQRLLNIARDKELSAWFNKQKNNVIKPAIESKLGKSFSSYEEAKNALFAHSEHQNIIRNSVTPKNKYSGLKSSGFGKQNEYLRDLKLLRLRAIEIKAGNINNPLYGFIKVDGTYLKDFKDLQALAFKDENIFEKFRPNNASTYFNNNVYKKLHNLDQGLTDEVVRLKNAYYNSFDQWKQLNYMQFLINYEDLKKLTAVPFYYPKLLEFFNKFKDTDKATSSVIENYAIQNNGGGSSLFTSNCIVKISHPRLTIEKEIPECKEAQKKALDKLLNAISTSDFAIANLIGELNITDTNQKTWLYTNRAEAGKLVDFLNANRVGYNVTNEAKNFAKEAVALDIILSKQLQVKQTGLIPSELTTCCPGYGNYDNDPIIKEYGIQPIQAAIDGTFNFIVSSVSLFKSDEWVGERVRRIMTRIGMNVPTDVTNKHLAAIFKIRKRNGVVIVEYRTGILKTMLDFGLNTLDMIAFLTPSKGGGAFLASKIGGLSITKMTEHLRKISINSTKVDNLVNSLKNNAKFDLNGTGKFKDVGGHHPLAKSAFKSDKFYDLKKAFSVSQNKLENAWKGANSGVPINLHQQITGQQNSLYSAFAKTGKVLTLDKMAQIEIKAMVNKGIPQDIATGWVIKALQDLKAQGVKVITHIPWNGIN